MSRPRARCCLVALGVLLVIDGGCQPVLRYLLAVREIEPEALHDWRRGPAPLVIDVRRAADFAGGHIAGAQNLTVAQLAGYLTREAAADRPVVAVCYRGTQSIVAAASAAGYGREVFTLRGGMERWTALGLPRQTGAGPPLDPQLTRPPEIAAPLSDQLATVACAFGIKPTYMLLSLTLIIVLWRQRARDLALIRSAMVAFLAGELVCLVNFFLGDTDSLDLVHGLGMLVMGALMPWGLFRMLDDRVLHVADPQARCVVQRLCGRCWKKEQVSCGVQRLFLFLAPALALLALMPLCTPLQRLDVVGRVFLSDVRWAKGLEAQLIEFRLYPLIALLLLLWTTIQLARGDRAALERAQRPFFYGFGFLSYSLMRFVLFVAYQARPTWSNWWEEITELIAVGAVALVLWVFRRQLGLVGKPAPGSGEAGEAEA